jgi:cytosine deaminase
VSLPAAILTLSPDPTALEPGVAAELAGRVVLPGLVEPHAHLDKALTADRVANDRGDLDGAIEVWLPYRERLTSDDIRERARTAALRYLAHGTTLIRTHVDTGPGIGLRAIEALLSLRAELADLVEIQVVAAASNPVEGPAGAESRALLRAALDAGADLVGGGPWLAEDPPQALDTLLDIAAEYGRGVDLHLDETLDPAVLTLPLLIERVREGFPGSVTASHCVSLGSQTETVRRRVAEGLAQAGIAIVTNPITNLYLQGRAGGGHAPRGFTAIDDLVAAGVLVAAGGDNLRDPFNPMGRADPLETAGLLVTAAHRTIAEAIAAVTVDARQVVLGVDRREAPGDLVGLAAGSISEAIAFGTADRIVVKGGRVVVRTSVVTTIENGAALEAPTRW